jgi:hypothetical protein
MKITDYKYRQLRKMVNRAKVRKPVKNLLFCALSDYKKQASIPQDGTFQENKHRCLIGAAIHNIGLHSSVFETNYEWERLAQKEFGIRPIDAEDIINGFDSRATNEDGDVTTASRCLAREFGKGNRVACLANRISLELLPNG